MKSPVQKYSIQKSNAGFTIIEVLAASVFLVIAVTFTGRYFVGSKIATKKSDNTFQATQAAIIQIEAAKDKYLNDKNEMDDLLDDIKKYASEVNFTQNTNGYGPIEKNKSNGERGDNDGKPLMLNGVVYEKGIGGHAYSELVWALDNKYDVFKAVVGIDDECPTEGTVIFKVYVDNTLKATSPIMRAADPGYPLSVSLKSASSLKLVITDAGNGKSCDHGDWANATLYKSIKDTLKTEVDGNDYKVILTYGGISGQLNAIRLDAEVPLDTNYSIKMGTGLLVK